MNASIKECTMNKLTTLTALLLAPLAALGEVPGPPGVVALAGRTGWPEQLQAEALTRTAEPPAEPGLHPR